MEPTPVDLPAVLVAPGSPVAESGDTTSEFKLLAGSLVADAVGLAVAFGAPVTAAQQSAIESFLGIVTAAVAAYAVSRGIRKHGTAA